MSARHDFALKGRRRFAKPYHFLAYGLPNVYLPSGVRIERDADHNELVSIDHLPDLIMAIAFSLVRKPERLTGVEMAGGGVNRSASAWRSRHFDVNVNFT
ncbi:MAG TPA: hypothetical protein VFZ16_18215 [Hyphomicrobiaceae bacterium]|nr:hypothetical protein [Hyphomicrobiaceae bacterium]